MSSAQWVAVLGSVVLVLVLYFGCETKPPQQSQVEKSRLLNAEATDIALLLRDAHGALSGAQLATIGTLEERLEQVTEDSARLQLFQQLSGRWYEFEQPAIAGHYAQEAAELAKTEEAWSIAGTTYAICVQRETEDRIRQFCSDRAATAFQNAISLNPGQVSHQVNLALVYTDFPPADNPMKGILMLRELQEKNPRNTDVLVSLGRLAIKTGQYQRAIQRLQQALAIEPSNRNANCLMAQAYEGLGDQALARTYEERCRGGAQAGD